MSSPSPPVHGLVAGKYEILDLIGRGGMGSVWQGRHASLGTRVAIKFVDSEHAQSQEARTRFLTEARAAAKIQSKHAIQIFDHGVTDDGRPYIVMELLQGEALDRRIEPHRRLALADTARILAQVCRALQRAHDAGVIHRDLKPENIFLVHGPDDDEEIAKVLDFGIAKIVAAPGVQGATSSTKTGAVLGTPYYMSPEQARGLRSIDHRTDLWSLGVIAYRCVTGALPFEGESVGDLLVNICTAAIPTPSSLDPSLPEAFDAWFFRAMQRDPARRFPQASELANSLLVAAGLSGGHKASQDELALDAPRLGPRDAAAGARDEAITSAPFTASAQAARPRRPTLIAVTLAALTGAALGVTAVLKLIQTPSHVAVSRGEDSPVARATVLAPLAPKASVELAVESKPPPSTSTASPKPSVSAASAPLPVGVSTTKQVSRGAQRPAATSLPTPSTKLPVAKPSPAADPGY